MFTFSLHSKALVNPTCTCTAPSSHTNTWLAWSAWSACSGTCGFAAQERRRVCNGTECVGIALMSRLCKAEPCNNAVDGHWSAWSHWSTCRTDSTCEHTKAHRHERALFAWNSRLNSLPIYRTRTCSSPSALNGGNPCFGAATETVHCPAPPSPRGVAMRACKNHLIDNENLLVWR